MKEPSVYERVERVEIINRHDEWMPVGHTNVNIREVAAWVESMGAKVADIGIEGFRYQNPGDDEWRWVNPGQWMHHYDGIEFDHPADSAPWDLSAMEHISGPALTDEEDRTTS